MPRVRAWAGASVLAAVSALGLAVPQAQAHAALVDSTPADGATVKEPLSEVTLVFNEPVQSDYAQIAVLDQDDNTYQDSDPSITGDTATQTVAELPDGKYKISYRIVSADGHPVSGTVAFTVAGGGGANAEPSSNDDQEPSRSAAEDNASSSNDSAVNAGWVAAGALFVIAVTVGTAAMLRRRTSPDAQPGGRRPRGQRDT